MGVWSILGKRKTKAMNDRRLGVGQYGAIVWETVMAIATAARFRVFDGKGAPPLPEVAGEEVLDPPTAQKIARLVGLITRLLVIWRRRICFYRSYATACVLRSRGVAVALNFGYRWDGPAGAMAHCWMTLDGQLFRETEETARIYSAYLGEKDPSVRFWTDPGNSPGGHEKLSKKELAG